MIYYLLPSVNTNIHNFLNVRTIETNVPTLNPSLCYYLQEIKHKIHEHEKEWDIYKKYTNPYEYINTICNQYSLCVSKYKPLSRSFFKMMEIIYTFELLDNSESISTFHLAEGPGGFIEAVAKFRENSNDQYVGMTLMDKNNDPNIPSWKKSEQFLKQNKNVYIETGATNTGDLLLIENFDNVITKYANKMDLITADGGFDFSTDFNNQENTIFKLLTAQICYALACQKINGTFVLKIFDCFYQNTIDLLYLLCGSYKKVYITKPQTSRYANSEKYIVCKGFNGYINANKLREVLVSVLAGCNINRIFSIDLPNLFINKMEEYNSIFGQQQLENINSTLRMIETKTKSDKIDSIIHVNISKCTKWCQKHNIEYNTFQKANYFY